jgi:purine-cytosine permease-like protein
MTQPSATIEQQNWKQLASVQVGGAICLPLLLVGYELAKHGNPMSMLFSILWGNLLLFALALIAGFMSTKRNLTTVEHASLYFGPKGRLFFALTLSSSMLGWFAIQTQCMGGDLYHFVQQFQENSVSHAESWKTALSFVLAALMIAGAFWGLQFFTWMSHICIPLLLATIGYAVYQAGALSWIRELSFDQISASLWNGKGLSLVLASSMAATIDLPTFYRHADNRNAPIIASIANYLIAMPLIQIAGMCLYYGTQASTISEALATQSSLPWKAWIVCFMLLAGWTTNNINLYSATLSFKSLYKGMSFSTAMGLVGVVGCFLVFIPVLEQFALALDLMGIFVVAMGGVMFIAYLLEGYAIEIKSPFVWMAWFAGIGAGLSALVGPYWGSGAPVLDAGLAAMLALPLLQLLDTFFRYSQQALMEEIG